MKIEAGGLIGCKMGVNPLAVDMIVRCHQALCNACGADNRLKTGTGSINARKCSVEEGIQRIGSVFRIIGGIAGKVIGGIGDRRQYLGIFDVYRNHRTCVGFSALARFGGLVKQLNFLYQRIFCSLLDIFIYRQHHGVAGDCRLFFLYSLYTVVGVKVYPSYAVGAAQLISQYAPIAFALVKQS